MRRPAPFRRQCCTSILALATSRRRQSNGAAVSISACNRCLHCLELLLPECNASDNAGCRPSFGCQNDKATCLFWRHDLLAIPSRQRAQMLILVQAPPPAPAPTIPAPAIPSPSPSPESEEGSSGSIFSVLVSFMILLLAFKSHLSCCVDVWI